MKGRLVSQENFSGVSWNNQNKESILALQVKLHARHAIIFCLVYFVIGSKDTRSALYFNVKPDFSFAAWLRLFQVNAIIILTQIKVRVQKLVKKHKDW